MGVDHQELHALMRDAGWLRRLARSLVDDASADDVVQEAWLIAADRAPTDGRPLRPWLHRVVVNLARMRHRGDRRRSARELRAGTDEHTTTPDEDVARTQLHRLVAETVVALGAAYRDVVVLHYVDGLTSIEIGRRLGISEGTVRWRLKTALDQLRIQLDRRTGGDRAAWLAALAGFHSPAAPTAVATAPTALGASTSPHGATTTTSHSASTSPHSGTTTTSHSASTSPHDAATSPHSASTSPSRGGASSTSSTSSSSPSSARGRSTSPHGESPTTTHGASTSARGGAGWRREIAGAAALFALGAAIAIAVVVTRGDDAESAGAEGAAGDRSESARAALPGWMGRPGAPARRISGRVMAGGEAVVGAQVELRAVGLPGVVAATRSDRAGYFMFGAQLATRYVLGATAAGRAPATLRVDLADPQRGTENLRLELASCVSRLTGTVSDASGGPIARARVRVDEVAGTEADDRGHYELCVPPEAHVVFDADGYAARAIDTDVTGTLPFDVVLLAEGVLAGTVATDDDRPVEGARVRAVPIAAHPGALERAALTDETGAFEIDGLLPGQFRLIAETAQLVGQTRPLDVRPGVPSGGHRIVVGAGVRIEGHVVRRGTPIPGVRVVAHEWGPSATELASAHSDLDGNVAIVLPWPATVRLAVPDADLAAPLDNIRAGAGTTEVTIELREPRAIEGRVTRAGRPVGGATVQCIAGRDEPTAVSDAMGGFRLAGLRRATCELVAYTIDTGWISEARELVLDELRGPVEVELADGASIAGIVVDEAGEPLPHVLVSVASDDDSADVMTDEHGAFAARCLVGGERYAIRVFPSPAVAAPFTAVPGRSPTELDLRDAHTHVSGVVIAVRAARGAVRGRVVDDVGAPVADAWIEVRGLDNRTGTMAPPSTETDREGRFAVPNLGVGGYVVHVQTPDGATTEQHATTGEPVAITLPRTGAVTGTLVGFSPEPTLTLGSLGDERARRWLDGNRFEFTGLRPGTYELMALGHGFDKRAVTIAAGATARIDLISQGVGRVEIDVALFRTGAPIAGASCQLEVPLSGGLGARSDAAGRARIDDAPAGTWTVRCWLQGHAIDSAPIELRAGATASVRVAAVVLPTPTHDLGFALQGRPARIAGVFRSPPPADVAVGDAFLAIDGVDVHDLGAETVTALLLSNASTARIRRGETERTIELAH